MELILEAWDDLTAMKAAHGLVAATLRWIVEHEDGPFLGLAGLMYELTHSALPSEAVNSETLR